MINVVIVCVNYNTYNKLYKYLESIENAIVAGVSVSIMIGDNSTIKEDLKYLPENTQVYKFDNIGYFGAAFSIINQIKNIDYYDYIIISNVDLLMKKDFFEKLLNLKCNDDCGWIATKIISIREKRNRNPKMLKRPSNRRMRLYKLLYKYPLLDFIYTRTFFKRKRREIENESKGIYAGHGSFILLTKKVFDIYKSLNYPCFLFGEEIFLGELMRRAGLKVVYESSLCIIDSDHESTSKMKSKHYYSENYKSIKYLEDAFFYE